MKKFLLLLLGLASYAPAQCQRWRIAPTVGINGSSIIFSSYYQNSLFNAELSTGTAIRGQLGAMIDCAINDRISIRSGLLYTAKGSSLQFTSLQNGTTRAGLPGNIFVNYFEIPLLVKVALGDNGLRLVGGAVLGIALNGKFSIDPTTISGVRINSYEYKMSIGNTFRDSLLPTDISISLGIVKELEFLNHPFEIGIHFQPSVMSFDPATQQNSKYSATNFLFGLKGAYFFEVGR